MRVNPPDFLLDCVALKWPQEFLEVCHAAATLVDELSPPSPQQHGGSVADDFLVTQWLQHEQQLQADKEAAQREKEEQEGEDGSEVVVFNPAILRRQTPGLVHLTWLHLRRAVVQLTRSKRNLAMDQVLIFIASVGLASIYWGDAMYQPPAPLQVFAGCPTPVAKQCQLSTSVLADHILTRGAMTCMAVALCGCASMIRVFGAERIV